MNLLYRLIGIALIALVILFASFTVSDTITTTVIVIEGKALLVDVDEQGEVITTYMEVPDYLTSSKEHDVKVVEAKASYMRLSKIQMDQIRFISILDLQEEYQTTMTSNLSDLAKHYHQTYANEIVITVARNDANKDLIAYNVEAITKELGVHGVSADDVTVEYKIDLGEDPSPFIKVSSGIRKLASL